MQQETYQESETRILAAVEELKASPELHNVKTYAAAHNLQYKRLLHRYNGGHSKSTRAPTNRRLNDAQEDALKGYLAGKLPK